ncbi:hypothetical protein cce_1385 [Crocosphaera subtropica ATCC 51142]|uniref:Uncharacterized protein n=1 Tax=Crocosphaera subtropica (strain ATCC 51142 / BH68) TaxID=43989 RepID=B1WWL1_CROS5|nr:hypothetical protein cce_1385 [Crocosphaera subtropica ATCC 51142]
MSTNKKRYLRSLFSSVGVETITGKKLKFQVVLE